MRHQLDPVTAYWNSYADMKVSGFRAVIHLSNGKRVANFSSPHPFTFTDGSVIPAVPNEISEALKIVFHEVEYDRGDVSLTFTLSPAVKADMDYWLARWNNAEVDVVFCALPMLVAIVSEHGFDYLINSPFRGIRMEDRIKKLASIDKQCITDGAKQFAQS